MVTNLPSLGDDSPDAGAPRKKASAWKDCKELHPMVKAQEGNGGGVTLASSRLGLLRTEGRGQKSERGSIFVKDIFSSINVFHDSRGEQASHFMVDLVHSLWFKLLQTAAI